MAKLTLPTLAVGFKDGKRDRKVPPKKKYHLAKHGMDIHGECFTVCGYIVWDNDFLDECCGGVDRDHAYEIVEIASLPAERLCKKCLGPLKAED